MNKLINVYKYCNQSNYIYLNDKQVIGILELNLVIQFVNIVMKLKILYFTYLLPYVNRLGLTQYIICQCSSILTSCIILQINNAFFTPLLFLV